MQQKGTRSIRKLFGKKSALLRSAGDEADQVRDGLSDDHFLLSWKYSCGVFLAFFFFFLCVRMCVGLLMQFHDTTAKPIWPSLHPREEQRAGKHSVLSRARSLCCSSPAAWVLLPRGFSASPWALCLLQHSWGSSFMLIAEPCCTALTQNLTGDAQRVMAWLAGVHELSWAGVHKASCGLDGSGGAGARGSAQTSIPW